MNKVTKKTALLPVVGETPQERLQRIFDEVSNRMGVKAPLSFTNQPDFYEILNGQPEEFHEGKGNIARTGRFGVEFRVDSYDPSLSDDGFRFILAHELTHAKSKDWENGEERDNQENRADEAAIKLYPKGAVETFEYVKNLMAKLNLREDPDDEHKPVAERLKLAQKALAAVA